MFTIKNDKSGKCLVVGAKSRLLQSTCNSAKKSHQWAYRRFEGLQQVGGQGHRLLLAHLASTSRALFFLPPLVERHLPGLHPLQPSVRVRVLRLGRSGLCGCRKGRQRPCRERGRYERSGRLTHRGPPFMQEQKTERPKLGVNSIPLPGPFGRCPKGHCLKGTEERPPCAAV
ncbi:hypothetical protein DBP15_17070 [Streptomyces sp. CS065A]|nr:hypothetical protein DBP15_17070 [Streptomyces sp. CS065A]